MMSIKSAFKRMIGTQAEDGQAIVLIALFMVVMLAMVGVAIDGGGLFLLWRDAQNAADTAALQAAYDRCTTDDETTWQATGYRAADINGFDDTNGDLDDPDDEDFSPDVQVTVQETFLGTPSVGYVHVIIEADKPAYFIQLVYRGPLRVRAEALVYCSGAVDFSTLPGMVGLGPCSCNGNWDNSIASTGARSKIMGSIHSNCEMKLNSGNHDNYVEGDATATQGIDGNDNTTIEGEEDGAADAIEMPATIPIDLYFPTGEIYEKILATQGDEYVTHITDTSASIKESDYPILEGLFAAEGDITFQNWNGSFGERGFTVVARGKINGIRTNHDGDTCLQNWCYYGHAFEDTEDPGVTVRWSRGNGSAIVFYSGLDSRPSCNNNEVGISLGGNGDDNDTDIDGFVYAPTSGIDWQGSSVGARGPIIGYRLSFSGADFLWIPEPAYLQPMAPVMSNAK